MDDRHNKAALKLAGYILVVVLLMVAFAGEFGSWAETLAYVLSTVGFLAAVWQWIRWFGTRRRIADHEKVS